EQAVPLMTERLIPVCSPAFAAAHPLPAPAAAFERAPLLHGSTDRRDWKVWARGWSGGDFDVDHGTTFDMLDLALRAAEAGHGIA
ncbi:LysR substrate-binding domain-containing protein, partial [Escherichia coli]|uniref:LysR substrate-binding domain-containing protein n=1 Tax=Escherichia coli TaxID=562 RepID=UPI0028DFAC91